MKLVVLGLLFAACASPPPVCPPRIGADLDAMFGDNAAHVREEETTSAPTECAAPEDATAAAAYRHLSCLWSHAEEGDTAAFDAYFESFGPTLDCFHGRSPYARAHVRRERIYDITQDGTWRSHELVVLEGGDDRALLADYGIWRRAGRFDVAERIVALRRSEERWVVTAETDRGHLGCLTGEQRAAVQAHRLPADVVRCRRATSACLRRCSRICAQEPSDGWGACGDCSAVECPCVLETCYASPELTVQQCMWGDDGSSE